MTNDEVMQRIAAILEDHAPGSYEAGLKLAAFLEAEAQKIRDDLSDVMSARTE